MELGQKVKKWWKFEYWNIIKIIALCFFFLFITGCKGPDNSEIALLMMPGTYLVFLISTMVLLLYVYYIHSKKQILILLSITLLLLIIGIIFEIYYFIPAILPIVFIYSILKDNKFRIVSKSFFLDKPFIFIFLILLGFSFLVLSNIEPSFNLYDFGTLCLPALIFTPWPIIFYTILFIYIFKFAKLKEYNLWIPLIITLFFILTMSLAFFLEPNRWDLTYSFLIFWAWPLQVVGLLV